MTWTRQALDWIFRPPTAKEYMRLPFIVLGLDLLYNLAVIIVLVLLGIDPEPVDDTHAVPIASWWFVLSIVWVSIEEEVIFRIIPLVLLLRYVRNRVIIMVAVLAISALFGYVHHGWESIAMQGVGGVLYSILFIKYAENGTRYYQASAVVILVHTIYNAIIMMIYGASGGTTF